MKTFWKTARPFIVILAVVLIFLLTYWILDGIVQHKDPQPALDITGVEYDETSLFSLSDNYGKTGTALLFFDPAVSESTDLLGKVLEANGERVDVLAVSVSGEPMAAQKQPISELSLDSAHILFDVEGTMAKTYNITTTPITYFIDKNGLVQDAFLGKISADSLEKAIQEIA